MTDYSELVEALRYYDLNKQAADAIEALQDDMKTYGKTAYDEGYAIGFAAGENKAEKQLPKRGEIVRCGECIHFTQGGWCDREFDWFPVDKNDFCSMAEKMEVQDGR